MRKNLDSNILFLNYTKINSVAKYVFPNLSHCSAQRYDLPLSFPVDLLLPYVVVNPPERRLTKRTSVQWAIRLWSKKNLPSTCWWQRCVPSRYIKHWKLLFEISTVWAVLKFSAILLKYPTFWGCFFHVFVFALKSWLT